MNTKINLITFKICNQTAVALPHNGKAYTPLRPIIEHLGLDWERESAYLVKYYPHTCHRLQTINEAGKACSVLCLQLSALTTFLLFVRPDDIKAELKEDLIAFQGQCDALLFLPKRSQDAADFSSLITPLFKKHPIAA